MKKPLVVRPEAEADMAAACRWYEDRSEGLGAEFLRCLDATMASIERNPRRYPVLHREIVRRALTRRFPYGVFFIEGKSSISVIGVIHFRRSPRALRRRI